MGCEIVQVYRDQGISGAKGRNGRPAFDALCKGAARREFDIVMAWSVDRLGRSLQDLVAFLTELHALKIDLYLHQQGVDTTTPGGKALFQMMGVFAEFERSIIQNRIHVGLARARAQGKHLGRPDPGHHRAQNPRRPEEGAAPAFASLPPSITSASAPCNASSANSIGSCAPSPSPPFLRARRSLPRTM